ncbi:hypothetical protein IQ268_12695 [Oculatella sp. LEGE 06141]|uniref:hypothetical protein n=1 Tax=Oculatella sp. LEGE 06141 TaxID=1828648 RepID=UPI00187EEAD4|nr:hypothetical protein [Oculatella sp. LEGE 06141]MBE9179421.1 hypothetical protein [Oculatella sp. LEGE 06141]
MAHPSNQPSQDDAKDVRLSALQKIWSYATGMLALAVIFTPVRHSTVISIAIVSGAAVSSAVVWRGDRASTSLSSPQAMKHLEERIANLEMIASNDELDLQRRIERLESGDRH